MDIDAKKNPDFANAVITAKFDEYVAVCEKRSAELGRRLEKIYSLQADIHARADDIRKIYTQEFLDG